MILRADQELDGWVLIALLGRGGNGEVWRAAHQEHGCAALKVLAKKSGDRWPRFCDEVKVMQKLGDRRGVLPLRAAELSTRRSRSPAWLATPVAEPIVQALGSDASLAAVVAAGQAIAETLADLAAQEIFHRDIKPDNLFQWEGQWVIGDFGLVDYPEKAAITTGRRRLGPLYFIAPEMIDRPDVARPGPADVYSLAKTLWVLATGQRYPPQGQIRVGVPTHNLAEWRDGAGTLALGLLLQDATAEVPEQRPTMTQFADLLKEWAMGDPTQDDRAAETLLRSQLSLLGEQLGDTIDPNTFGRIETQFREVVAEARKRSHDKQQRLMAQWRGESEASRQSFIDDYGVKAALELHDTPWVGSLRDADDVIYAVRRKAPSERQAALVQARQILWGRPLWWMHSAGLTAALELRAEDGCEPLATEIAAEEVRHHLLDFADHPTLAAAWRLQRAQIPLIARTAGYGPLNEVAQSQAARLSAADRLKAPPNAGHVLTMAVRNVMRAHLRALDWFPDTLNAAAEEAESLLARLPTPSGEWHGPVTDPWLQSWADYSPLLTCGLAILRDRPSGDDLLDADDLRQTIYDAATSEYEMLRRPAIPLAERLGLL